MVTCPRQQAGRRPTGRERDVCRPGGGNYSWWAMGFGLGMADALGSLVDRLFRPPGPFHGHVVDFVSVFAPNGEVWPVFNIADSCICVGAVLIVVLSLFGRDHEGNPKTLAQRDRGTDSGEDERD